MPDPTVTTGPDTVHETGQPPACYHCGDPCSEHDVVFEGHHFCCMGCRTVYELLSSKEMCAYYDSADDAPGISPTLDGAEVKYGYLDDSEVVRQITDFHDGTLARATFTIPTMHCASCIWLLENLHDLQPEVTTSRVNFLKKELMVAWRVDQLSLRRLVELLARIGYEPQIRLEDIHRKEHGRAQRALIMRVGVAGFAFGNIMLLSFPEYFAAGGEVEALLRHLFRYLNLALAIPVLLYSAQPYWSSAFKGLRAKVVNLDVPITLGITVLFARSVYEVLAGVGPGYFDSLAGLVFLLLVGRIFQEKTYAALSFERDYSSYFPLSATLLEGSGRELSVPVTRLQPGSRIVVRNQELIPADAVLLNGSGNIDYSFVTGESDPVAKESGDVIYAGGRQLGAALELEVIEEVSRSHLVRLWNQDAFTRDREGRYTAIANRISKWFTAAILLVAAGAFALWAPHGIGMAVQVFTAILIVACPCALALATPFTLGTAMRLLGRRGFYLKNADVVERLAAITTVVFDKTGTLTAAGGGEARWEGHTLAPEERAWVRSVVRHSTHPLSMKVHAALTNEGSHPVARIEERPGAGLEGVVAGHTVRVGSASWVGAEVVADGASRYEREESAGEAWVAIDGRVKGRYTVVSRYRPGLADVLHDLRHRFHLALLSGDTQRDQSALSLLFGGVQDLLFRQSPEEKLAWIEGRQAKGEHVLMIGDGLNDAGALKAASVGVAVSEDVSSFSPACDGLLDAATLPQLHAILRFARRAVKVITAAFVLSFAYNLVGLSFAAAGKLSPLVSAILMPLSSITVVVFTTVLTTFTARATLGRTPPPTMGRDAR